MVGSPFLLADDFARWENSHVIEESWFRSWFGFESTPTCLRAEKRTASWSRSACRVCGSRNRFRRNEISASEMEKEEIDRVAERVVETFEICARYGEVDEAAINIKAFDYERQTDSLARSLARSFARTRALARSSNLRRSRARFRE